MTATNSSLPIQKFPLDMIHQTKIMISIQTTNKIYILLLPTNSKSNSFAVAPSCTKFREKIHLEVKYFELRATGS